MNSPMLSEIRTMNLSAVPHAGSGASPKNPSSFNTLFNSCIFHQNVPMNQCSI